MTNAVSDNKIVAGKAKRVVARQIVLMQSKTDSRNKVPFFLAPL